MTTKTAGVLGAVTLLAGAGAAQAMPGAPQDLATVMNPTSYAELLQPIPNATALLAASDAQASPLPLAREGDAAVEEAQFYHHHHHHHHHHHFRGYVPGPFFHHHHHGFYRRFYHHHHHHHHFYRYDY